MTEEMIEKVEETKEKKVKTPKPHPIDYTVDCIDVTMLDIIEYLEEKDPSALEALEEDFKEIQSGDKTFPQVRADFYKKYLKAEHDKFINSKKENATLKLIRQAIERAKAKAEANNEAE